MEQQTKQAYDAAKDLTTGVKDAQNKPYLRGSLKTAMKKLGHLESVCNDALDRFFDGPKLVK